MGGTQDKRALWADRLVRWAESGLSQVGWCRAQGLSVASFGYWRRRLREEAAPVGLLPIVRSVADARAAVVQLHLPGDLRVEVPGHADPVHVAALVRALRAC